MTAEEKRQAEERLQYLITDKRSEIVARIQEARSHGDLSENAEYEAARNEQALLEDDIKNLEEQIKNAKVVEESADNSVVHIGSRVTVRGDMIGEVAYTIKGSYGADPKNNIIANDSPVGKALSGRKVGDVVTVEAPMMSFTLTIVRIDAPEDEGSDRKSN